MEFESTYYCDQDAMDEVVLHDSAEDQFELYEGNDYEDSSSTNGWSAQNERSYDSSMRRDESVSEVITRNTDTRPIVSHTNGSDDRYNDDESDQSDSEGTRDRFRSERQAGMGRLMGAPAPSSLDFTNSTSNEASKRQKKNAQRNQRLNQQPVQSLVSHNALMRQRGSGKRSQPRNKGPRNRNASKDNNQGRSVEPLLQRHHPSQQQQWESQQGSQDYATSRQPGLMRSQMSALSGVPPQQYSVQQHIMSRLMPQSNISVNSLVGPNFGAGLLASPQYMPGGLAQQQQQQQLKNIQLQQPLQQLVSMQAQNYPPQLLSNIHQPQQKLLHMNQQQQQLRNLQQPDVLQTAVNHLLLGTPLSVPQAGGLQLGERHHVRRSDISPLRPLSAALPVSSELVGSSYRAPFQPRIDSQRTGSRGNTAAPNAKKSAANSPAYRGGSTSGQAAAVGPYRRATLSGIPAGADSNHQAALSGPGSNAQRRGTISGSQGSSSPLTDASWRRSVSQGGGNTVKRHVSENGQITVVNRRSSTAVSSRSPVSASRPVSSVRPVTQASPEALALERRRLAREERFSREQQLLLPGRDMVTNKRPNVQQLSAADVSPAKVARMASNVSSEVAPGNVEVTADENNGVEGEEQHDYDAYNNNSPGFIVEDEEETVVPVYSYSNRDNDSAEVKEASHTDNSDAETNAQWTEQVDSDIQNKTVQQTQVTSEQQAETSDETTGGDQQPCAENEQCKYSSEGQGQTLTITTEATESGEVLATGEHAEQQHDDWVDGETLAQSSEQQMWVADDSDQQHQTAEGGEQSYVDNGVVQQVWSEDGVAEVQHVEGSESGELEHAAEIEQQQSLAGEEGGTGEEGLQEWGVAADNGEQVNVDEQQEWNNDDTATGIQENWPGEGMTVEQQLKWLEGNEDGEQAPHWAEEGTIDAQPEDSWLTQHSSQSGEIDLGPFDEQNEGLGENVVQDGSCVVAGECEGGYESHDCEATESCDGLVTVETMQPMDTADGATLEHGIDETSQHSNEVSGEAAVSDSFYSNEEYQRLLEEQKKKREEVARRKAANRKKVQQAAAAAAAKAKANAAIAATVAESKQPPVKFSQSKCAPPYSAPSSSTSVSAVNTATQPLSFRPGAPLPSASLPASSNVCLGGVPRPRSTLQSASLFPRPSKALLPAPPASAGVTQRFSPAVRPPPRHVGVPSQTANMNFLPQFVAAPIYRPSQPLPNHADLTNQRSANNNLLPQQSASGTNFGPTPTRYPAVGYRPLPPPDSGFSGPVARPLRSAGPNVFQQPTVRPVLQQQQSVRPSPQQLGIRPSPQQLGVRPSPQQLAFRPVLQQPAVRQLQQQSQFIGSNLPAPRPGVRPTVMNPNYRPSQQQPGSGFMGLPSSPNTRPHAGGPLLGPNPDRLIHDSGPGGPYARPIPSPAGPGVPNVRQPAGVPGFRQLTQVIGGFNSRQAYAGGRPLSHVGGRPAMRPSPPRFDTTVNFRPSYAAAEDLYGSQPDSEESVFSSPVMSFGDMGLQEGDTDIDDEDEQMKNIRVCVSAVGYQGEEMARTASTASPHRSYVTSPAVRRRQTTALVVSPTKTETSSKRVVVNTLPQVEENSSSEGRSVLIYNLAHYTTEDYLFNVASEIGPVDYVDVNGANRQALIAFCSPQHAYTFVQQYDRQLLDSSLVNVTLIAD